jgi:hypothetical protein
LPGPPFGDRLLEGVKLSRLHRLPAIITEDFRSAGETVHANREPASV